VSTLNSTFQPVESSRRQLPWEVMSSLEDLHGQNFDNVAEALEATGLDYRVEKWYDEAVHPVTGERVRADKRVALVRPAPRGQSGKINLGVTGTNYGLQQNPEAFEVFDRLKREYGVKIVGAAEYRSGAAALFIGRLPEPVVLYRNGREDVTDLYVYGRNGFAGTTALYHDALSARISCTNVLRGGGSLGGVAGYSARHTRNVATKVRVNADALMADVDTYVRSFNDAAQAMVAQEIGEEAVDRFLAQLFPIKDAESEEHVQNVTTRRQAIKGLAYYSPTLEGFHGTPWAAVQGVTEFVDHYRPTRDDSDTLSRAEGAIEGKWSDLKTRAWDLAVDSFLRTPVS
jgi:phage/plasmid-like protein (TIGR03299 family)